MENSMGVVHVQDGDKIYDVSLSTMGETVNGRQIIRFGKNADNDIVLNSECASQAHGCFYIENGEYYIEDRNSRNGLYFSGHKWKKKRLVSGDVIEIRGNKEEGSISFTCL